VYDGITPGIYGALWTALGVWAGGVETEAAIELPGAVTVTVTAFDCGAAVETVTGITNSGED
jgi:hypothetical protein